MRDRFPPKPQRLRRLQRYAIPPPRWGGLVTGLTNYKPATSTYTVTYAPDYQETHTLSKIADFDTRLLLLEKLLGAPNTTLPPSPTTPAHAHAIIPTLNELARKISILTNSTPSSLEAASRRIKVLVKEAEELARARKAAAEAAVDAPIEPLEDEQMVSKINALYGVLPTIEGLAPLLPGVLDRLRSLRRVHADAARAGAALEEVERRQEECEVEIRKWEETLERVEGAVVEGRGTVEENVGKVEGWVRELEGRMERLV